MADRDHEQPLPIRVLAQQRQQDPDTSWRGVIWMRLEVGPIWEHQAATVLDAIREILGRIVRLEDPVGGP